jgi:hypothetical protein
VKKFKDILRDMVTWLALTNTKVTNFTVGSVARSIMEAVAIEIESLYYFIQSKFEALQENSIYNSFGFQKRPPTPSTGTVTVNFNQALSQSVLFPTGAQFYTVPIDGQTIYFASTQDVIANIGSRTVNIPVQCTQAGTIGNVPSYTIRRAVQNTPVMGDIYNASRFFTGAPEESKEERKKRFSTFVRGIARATPDALTYGCLQVTNVAGVIIQEGIGMVYVYAHNADGDLTDQMKTDLTTALYNYRAAGIMSFVNGVTKKPIDLNIQVLINPGYNTDTILFKVEDLVTVYLSKFTVSKSLIKADLIRYIMEIDKEAISNINIDLTADVVVATQELIRPGSINVTEME